MPSIKLFCASLNILDSFLLQNQMSAAKNIIQHLEQYGIPENF